jgi:hypothetical protein
MIKYLVFLLCHTFRLSETTGSDLLSSSSSTGQDGIINWQEKQLSHLSPDNDIFTVGLIINSHNYVTL